MDGQSESCVRCFFRFLMAQLFIIISFVFFSVTASATATRIPVWSTATPSANGVNLEMIICFIRVKYHMFNIDCRVRPVVVVFGIIGLFVQYNIRNEFAQRSVNIPRGAIQ